MLSDPLHITAQVPAERLAEVCGDDPTWVCRNVLDQLDSRFLAEAADWLVGVPLRILLIVVIASLAVVSARRAIKVGLRRMTAGGLRRRISAAARGRAPRSLFETREHAIERSSQRVEVLALVLASSAAFVIWIVAGMMILAELGISLAPLVASAGVAGIALGFGAQSLIRDFLSGMFILIEDQFAVGDIIDVGEAVGEVEALSLRVTRLRSVDGTVWHVPNGEIRRVGNMSQHWSRSLLDIDVGYDTDLDRAQQVIKRVADELWRQDSNILEEPSVWGVEAFGTRGITIRLVIKTRPLENWRISRELRGRIKVAFDSEGIEIPFPQQTVHYRADPPPSPDPQPGEPSA